MPFPCLLVNGTKRQNFFKPLPFVSAICRERKINLRQTKNHSAEIDFSFGAEKGTILRCKINVFHYPIIPLTVYCPPKKTAPSLLVLTFFKIQAYCNSLPDGNTCCVSTRGNSAPRSKSKMTNDKKLISCIQEKKLPNQTVRQTYPVYFSKIRRNPAPYHT